MIDMEVSSDSSLALCDEFSEIVTPVKKKRRRDRPREVDLVMGECSKETHELLQRCADYVRLYYLRYQEKRIPKKIINQMVELFDIYGVPIKGGINPNTLIVQMNYPEFCNLMMFLDQMDQVESQIGRHLWDLYYISSADLFAGCEKSSHHFTIRVISVIRKVFDAVRKRQFEKAVLVIGNIRLVSSKLPSERHYMKSTLQAFSFYFPSLFYVVLQRHLESGCPLQVISEKYSEVVSSFMGTCIFKNQAYNYTEFYLTEFLIFHLAHQLLDEADKALEHKLTHQDPEWSRIRQIYRYWLDYEKWQNELQEVPTARLSPTLSSFFSTILDSSLRTTHGPPMECVGFLPVLIRVAEVLSRMDELQDALVECCCSDASLLSQVTRTLNFFGLHHVSGFLLSKALDLIPADNLASYDFVIDIVEQQSLDPAGHGAFEDLIALNLRMLFNFMDHGRNRGNARAWGLLKANILYVGTEVEAFLRPLWNHRRCWWPAFHSVALEKEARKARRSVFNVLNSLK